jgi:hypothetical protein
MVKRRVSLSILALVVFVTIAVGMSNAAGGGQESPPPIPEWVGEDGKLKEGYVSEFPTPDPIPADAVQVIPQEPLNGIPQEPVVITRTKPDLGREVTERTFTYQLEGQQEPFSGGESEVGG